MIDTAVRVFSHRNLLAIVFALVAMPAHAATHYLTLINDDDVMATKIEAAPHGSTDYKVLDGATPLQGGSAGQATIAFRGATCIYDLRIHYASRGPLTINDWNVCRSATLHLGKAWRTGVMQTRASS